MEVVDMGQEEDGDLANCSTTDLIEKIRKLKIHVKQLRNVIHKSASVSQGQQLLHPEEPNKKKARKERPFNFDMHPRRHVLLKVAYLGWDLQGLASQEDTTETIEEYLFNALLRTKLIQSRETSNYHRCGRTDKGVSAFAQVVSLDLRCKALCGIGVKSPVNPKIEGVEKMKETDSSSPIDEINYPVLLNRVLPKEIRVVAWAPVHENFSARYDCVQRTYKYLFPKHQLNIKLMLEAAESLVGVHDFRNFCKLDTSGRKSTVREILEVGLEDTESEWGIVALRIKGRSFIWHQIRCILAILFLVGKGLEEPSIVSTLLDIKKHPKKPQYPMAVDFPLVLFQVDHGELVWEVDKDNLCSVQKDLATIALRHRLKASMIDGMLVGLEGISGAGLNFDQSLSRGNVDSLTMGLQPKLHRALLSRPVCQKSPETDKKDGDEDEDGWREKKNLLG